MIQTRSKAISFIFDNSLLLLAGTAAAVVWANLDVASYDGVAYPLHFWVNDVEMVFFFALAAKEVFEATLPGGSLTTPRGALSPLAAAVGGMVAPALIYVALASTRGGVEMRCPLRGARPSLLEDGEINDAIARSLSIRARADSRRHNIVRASAQAAIITPLGRLVGQILHSG